MSPPDIQEYYDHLARDYDKSRFGNNYGRFLDKQEQAILVPMLELFDPRRILNLGCGSGRFMEYCQYGVDFSPVMIEVAQEKYPHKEFMVADAKDTGFPDQSFDLVLCLHLIMHQDRAEADLIFQEALRLLRPGGRFVFDIPSALRRRKTQGHHSESWHGSNAYTSTEIQAEMGRAWEYVTHKGLLFLPIHRIPDNLRMYFYGMDSLLCRNLSPDYASYMLMVMQKEDNPLKFARPSSLDDITQGAGA